MPLFTWIGKEKVVSHDKEVPFRLLRKNKSLSLGEHSKDLIVEGDNLEALKALLPFYYGKVKCIYIDPPYNTGNEKWVYNDKVNSPHIREWLGRVVGPEGEDLTRHDKWLCMMYPRLKLLHQLLRDDGVIFISIDDNEHCNLKMLMDDIFLPENFVATFIWNKKNVVQNDARFVSVNHDFVICYIKQMNDNRFNLLPRTEEQTARYENPDNDSRGPWTSVALQAKSGSIANLYEMTFPNGITWKPVTGTFPRLSKESLLRAYKEGRLWFGKNGSNVPRLKKYISEVKAGIVSNSILSTDDVGSTQLAKETIKQILGNNDFDTPKPVGLIKRFIQLTCGKDDIILDSFAGSGTTAQAVMELNKEDGGNRKFILVELEKKIAREITQERVRRVAQKLGGGSFEYAELGVPLFKADGNINENVSFEEMASYVYFTETLSHIVRRKIKGVFIGEYNGTEYYLLFKQKGDPSSRAKLTTGQDNILNRAALKSIKKDDERKVIYADKCLLSEEILEKNHIVFKQIPYQVRVY